MKPMLCRVFLYFIPGLPSPTMIIINTVFRDREPCPYKKSLTVTNNGHGQRFHITSSFLPFPLPFSLPFHQASSLPLLSQSSLLSLPLPRQRSSPQPQRLVRQRVQWFDWVRQLPLNLEAEQYPSHG